MFGELTLSFPTLAVWEPFDYSGCDAFCPKSHASAEVFVRENYSTLPSCVAPAYYDNACL